MVEEHHAIAHQIIPLMVPFVFIGIGKPIVVQTAKLLSSVVAPIFAETMGADLVLEVSPHLARMLSVATRMHLSSVLVDSLTYTLSKITSTSLIRSVGPFLVDRMYPHLRSRLARGIHITLVDKMAISISRDVTDMNFRAIQLFLQAGLTRSITHALVPTLSSTIAHHKNSDEFCMLCHRYKTHCHLCHFSQETMYYTHYHSAYFSEWYADYYADYYLYALQLLDVQLNLEKETNQKMNGLHTAITPDEFAKNVGE